MFSGGPMGLTRPSGNESIPWRRDILLEEVLRSGPNTATAQMDLTDLYQEIVLDHGKNPRNRREMPDANRTAEGYNPLCGDQIKVWIKVEGGIVVDASFTGQGCAISQASASMMTQALKGQSEAEAERLFEAFRGAVTGGSMGSGCDHEEEPTCDEAAIQDELGILSCLTGVRNYPNRIKCATLAWHAMHSALTAGERVSTE